MAVCISQSAHTIGKCMCYGQEEVQMITRLEISDKKYIEGK